MLYSLPVPRNSVPSAFIAVDNIPGSALNSELEEQDKNYYFALMALPDLSLYIICFEFFSTTPSERRCYAVRITHCKYASMRVFL